MRARAGGLLLFSFAFSSVISATEILSPSKSIDSKNLDLRELRLANNYRRSTNEADHKLEKRETEIFRSTLDPAFSSQKEFDGSLLNQNVIADRDDLNNPNRFDSDESKGKEYQTNGFESCCKIEIENGKPAIDKRNMRNYKELLGGKRAPLAFHGMRGKKSEYYENEWPIPEVLDVRPFSTKQKYLIASGLLDDGNEILEPEDPEWPDRSAVDAFDEEYAKKRSPYSLEGMNFKRAMGFLGMRGKKAPEVWNPYDFKRAPQSAFFGMKGKKAQSGFFGMRGKKFLPSNSYGVPGFEEPLEYDFQANNFLDQMKDRESSKNRFRRGDGQLSSVKKTKNAFFGVKGKKSTDEDSRSNLFSSYK